MTHWFDLQNDAFDPSMEHEIELDVEGLKDMFREAFGIKPKIEDNVIEGEYTVIVEDQKKLPWIC